MVHLESVDSYTDVTMDPENEQDNKDCKLELPVDNPDFLTKDSDNLPLNQINYHCHLLIKELTSILMNKLRQ